MWFSSSTQPISISRSPFRQSRPVVSVSKTISRMTLVLVRFAAGRKTGASSLPRILSDAKASARRIASTSRSAAAKPAAGIDEEMRPPPLLRIRHLAGEERCEFLLRHARPGQDAGALHFRRRL